jgi:GTP pyrophosphokinase
MHRRAEYGVAAHWKYKAEVSGSAPVPGPILSAGGDKAVADDMPWLRQLLDWQQETSDPAEFLDSLRFDLAGAEVYVFTPGGDVIGLPERSTPVDLAYAVHTEVGHRCIGARVNGRLVPLESLLNNGDVVEILTAKGSGPGSGPSRDWLEFVASPRARNKIKQWFSKERREEAVERGKEEIARTMRKQGLPIQRLLTSESLTTIAHEMRLPDITALYAAVGERHASAQNVVSRLMASLGGTDSTTEDMAETVTPTRTGRFQPHGDPGVAVKGVDDVWVKLARCCTPVPGDPILGFVTRGNGVSVHRGDCTNAGALSEQKERMVDVEWAPTKSSMFLVAIQVEALDRSGLLADVTRVLSDQHVNILSATVATSRDRTAISKFTFEMADPKHLVHVLKHVRNVPGVFDAYRTTGAAAEAPRTARR